MLGVNNIIDNEPNATKLVSHSGNNEQQGTCQCLFLYVCIHLSIDKICSTNLLIRVLDFNTTPNFLNEEIVPII